MFRGARVQRGRQHVYGEEDVFSGPPQEAELAERRRRRLEGPRRVAADVLVFGTGVETRRQRSRRGLAIFVTVPAEDLLDVVVLMHGVAVWGLFDGNSADVVDGFGTLGRVAARDGPHDVVGVVGVGRDGDVVDDEGGCRGCEGVGSPSDEEAVVRRRRGEAEGPEERRDFFICDASGVRVPPEVALDVKDRVFDVEGDAVGVSAVEVLAEPMRKARGVCSSLRVRR